MSQKWEDIMESLANNLESIDASAVNNCDTEG